MRTIETTVLCVVLAPALCVGDEGALVEGSFSREIRRTVGATYLVYMPATLDATPSVRWPVILFLHGAGERGTDPSPLAELGPLAYARAHADFPFLVAAPLCPPQQGWSPDLVIALLDVLVETYPVDTDRVYLTGFSMGGWGTWETAIDFPDRFAAIAPLCGRTIPLLAFRLWQMPVWVFHGAQDDVVPVHGSREMITVLREMGNPKVQYTEYPDLGHDVWTMTYRDPALYAWFLQHRRSDRP